VMNAGIELSKPLSLDSGEDAATPADEVAAPPAPRAGAPATPAPAAHSLRIVPPQGWQPLNVRELWDFRELLFFLTWRDVKVRYKQTALGAAWAVLQPAMLMVVFTILFGRMVKVDTGGLPYPVFSYLGLVLWTFFSTAIANAGN